MKRDKQELPAIHLLEIGKMVFNKALLLEVKPIKRELGLRGVVRLCRNEKKEGVTVNLVSLTGIKRVYESRINWFSVINRIATVASKSRHKFE